VKDINKIGKKMARNGPTAAIFKFSFISEQSIGWKNTDCWSDEQLLGYCILVWETSTAIFFISCS
jgi:hypothetical protein